MKTPASATVSEYDLVVDHEDWTAILESSLCQDEAVVELLAHLLFTIRKEIESGPDGVIQASKTLLNGIELIYLHTKAHKAALKLFMLSLEGNLKPQDEPFNLINGAIERVTN